MKNDFIELIKMNCGVNQSKLRWLLYTFWINLGYIDTLSDFLLS